MVEHEIAMAIHHLKEWHQLNHPIDSDPKSWMSVECALSWLEDAQNKMDAARQERISQEINSPKWRGEAATQKEIPIKRIGDDDPNYCGAFLIDDE